MTSSAGLRGALAALLVLSAALSASRAAPAAEMVVQGEVVDVVPISGPGRSGQVDCHPPKPAQGAGLVELLQWDLRADCTADSTRQNASGYRVYYRWDGRTYSQVMREPPGDSVSLRVRLE